MKLIVVILIALMIDWIFFDGGYAVLPIVNAIEAAAGFLAGLVM